MQRPGNSVLGSKACSECFRAKVRCEAGQSAAVCDRCERLSKKCVVEPRKTRRPRRTTPGALNKPYVRDILELQSKVESLEQLFSAALGNKDNERVSPRGSPGDMQAASNYNSPKLSPSSKEGEEALLYFQHHMAPMFPFVVVPPGTAPVEFAKSKPVLWMAIALVSYGHDQEKRSLLSKEFQKEVSQRLFVREERTLDLLQGILVYTAWNHLHQITLAVSLWSSLLHAAISLITDMNLDEEPGNSTTTRTGLGALRQFEQSQQVSQIERTLEERRALLGVFLLSSVSSTCLRDVHGIPAILALRRSLEILRVTRQYRSDSYLVHMVQMQLVADSIRSILYRGFLEAEPITPESVFVAFRSLQVSVQAIGTELEEAMSKQRESTDLYKNPGCVDGDVALLSVGYCSLQIYLYKISLDDRLFDDANLQESPVIPSFETQLGARPLRNELLTTVLTAGTKLLEHLCHLDNAAYDSLPYLTWIQLGHAILMLSRVVTVSHEMGDLMLFLESLSGFRDGIEQLGRKMEEITSRSGDGEQSARPRLPPIFGQIPAKLKEIREIVEATVENQDSATGAGPWTYSTDMHVPVEMDSTLYDGRGDIEWV